MYEEYPQVEIPTYRVIGKADSTQNGEKGGVKGLGSHKQCQTLDVPGRTFLSHNEASVRKLQQNREGQEVKRP